MTTLLHLSLRHTDGPLHHRAVSTRQRWEETNPLTAALTT